MDSVHFVLIDWEDMFKVGPTHIHPELKNNETIVDLEPSYNGLYSMTVIDKEELKDKGRKLLLQPSGCNRLDCTDASHYWLEDWVLGHELHCIAFPAPESPSAEPVLRYI